MISFSSNTSRKILFRLVLLSAGAAAAAVAAVDFISDVYLENQLTPTGLVINGSILALFLLGMGRIVALLVRYAREETALEQFIVAMEEGGYHPAAEVDPNSLIFQRYQSVLALSKEHAPINQNALASMLLARESTRVSLPRFINNILILMGVFGTIVSLSIALVGASNLIATTEQLGNMGLVIHGMSTALATTITAIACYLFHGYFYLKLSDAQTQVVSAVEQVTSLYLVPKYSRSPDGLLTRVAALVDALQETAEQMREVQAEFRAAGTGLTEAVASIGERVEPVAADLRAVKGLLREGFRLSQPEVD